VPAILDAYGIPYTFSDPLVMALTLHKGLTKTVVATGGVPTSPFAVVESINDVARIELPLPLFVKPVAEGTGKGISPTSKVNTASELRSICQQLLEKHAQPVLVEVYLPGREFTVGILGTGAAARTLGTLEIILLPDAEAGAYSYVNKERCEDLVEYRLVHAAHDEVVQRAEDISLRAWTLLGCRDAGRVDLRCDAAGQPQFMEVNPLAGLHPEHSDLPILATKVGLSYTDLIGHIVNSAAERIAATKYSKARRFRT
jgi:D-alanine-D-alanine ligase